VSGSVNVRPGQDLIHEVLADVPGEFVLFKLPREAFYDQDHDYYVMRVREDAHVSRIAEVLRMLPPGTRLSECVGCEDSEATQFIFYHKREVPRGAGQDEEGIAPGFDS
jgi:hypothetical protein